LQEHGSITSLEAIELFGATRLSAIVFNLRRRGYEITTETLATKDRYGHAVNYAKYVYHHRESEALPEKFSDNQCDSVV